MLFVLGCGLGGRRLLPGRGHVHEPLGSSRRGRSQSCGGPGTVEQLRPGMPGYRLRLPEKVHPISAGIKGGIVGGLVMPCRPGYGLLSGHGIWYPVNLLAGMVLPGIERCRCSELEQFQPGAAAGRGRGIHAVMSLVFGLIYGVLLPTLPRFPRPLAWGGLLMPLLWTGVSFG